MPAATVWRIARRPHALDRSGVGARDSGGRWNAVGAAVIYAGGTIAIAELETFAHVSGVVPPDLVLVRVALPARYSSDTPALSGLPAWNALPPEAASQRFGTQWVAEKRSLVLYVPSVIVPEEFNAVLNPSHPEFADVKMTVTRSFHYDPRLFAPRTAPR